MKILLDANMLIYAVKHKVDLEQLAGEELLTLDAVLKELKRISTGKSRGAANARLALMLVEKKNVRAAKSRRKSADAAILDYARRNGATVATNDAALIKSLKKKGIRVIRLRQKRLLIEE